MAKDGEKREGGGGGRQGAGGSGSDWRSLHLWQIQPVRDLLVIAGVFGVVYLGYALRLVTVPLLLALLLAYLFEPVVRRMTRVRWVSRQGAAAVIILVLVVAVVAPVTVAVGFGVAQGVSFSTNVISNVDAVARSVRAPEDEQLYESLPGEFWRGLRDAIVENREVREHPLVLWGMEWVRENAGMIGRQAVERGADALGVIVRGAGSAGRLLFGLFLTAFFFFFVCSNYERVLGFCRGLIPERGRDRALDLIWQMDVVVSGFVRGRLTIAVVQSAVFTVGYWLVGVPAPLLVGPLVGILAIMPYVSLVGIPLTMALMWIEPSSVQWQTNWWWILTAPVAVYVFGQLLDDYLLTPMIQGKATNMDVPTILFASLAGGVLAGFYGLLLAIPVAACLKILLREVFWPRFRAWSEGRERDFLPIGES